MVFHVSWCVSTSSEDHDFISSGSWPRQKFTTTFQALLQASRRQFPGLKQLSPVTFPPTSTALICSLTPSSSCSLNGIRCEKNRSLPKPLCFFVAKVSVPSLSQTNNIKPPSQSSGSTSWPPAWQVMGAWLLPKMGGRGWLISCYHVTWCWMSHGPSWSHDPQFRAVPCCTWMMW